MAHHQGYPRQARQGGSLLHPRASSRASSHSRHDGTRMNSDPHPPPTTKARSSNTQRRTQILLTNCPTEQRGAGADPMLACRQPQRSTQFKLAQIRSEPNRHASTQPQDHQPRTKQHAKFPKRIRRTADPVNGEPRVERSPPPDRPARALAIGSGTGEEDEG